MKVFRFQAIGKFAFIEEIKAENEADAKEIFTERLGISTEHFAKIKVEKIENKLTKSD